MDQRTRVIILVIWKIAGTLGFGLAVIALLGLVFGQPLAAFLLAGGGLAAAMFWIHLSRVLWPELYKKKKGRK